MRILYVSPTNCLGGAERVLLSIMAAVRAAERSVEIHLLLGGDGPLIRRAEEAGARVLVVPMPPALAVLGDSQLQHAGSFGKLSALLPQAVAAAPAAWGYVARLRRQIRRLAPDLVHSNGLKTHLLGRLAVMPGIPVLWHAHDFYSRRPAAARLLRLARGGAAKAIAVSQAVAHDLRRIVPNLPIQVVHNTIDTAHFTPSDWDGRWLDAAAGLPTAVSGTIRIGIVAAYARWKGQDVFLQAAARLSKTCREPPLRFYVIGGPIYETCGSQFSQNELRALARRCNVEQQVGFVGFVEDPVAAFQALDIVVHASTAPEPFGLTIVEAMACGKPVVAVQAGGPAELFQNGHDAQGVPPGCADSLAAAIHRLVADPSLRRRLGDNARGTVLARFGSASLGARFIKVYEGMYKQPCGRG